jgi:hypothetical protein
MTWTGDPEKDIILTLIDGELILGQVSRDGQSKDWHGYYYTLGDRNHVGVFESPLKAKHAVEVSVGINLQREFTT